MKKSFPLLLVLCATVAGCAYYGPHLTGSNMPRSTDVQAPAAQPQAYQQEVLSSARHWELVAADVAQGLCDVSFGERCVPASSWTSSGDAPGASEASAATPEAPSPYHCVKLAFSPGDGASAAFPQVFRGSVVRELIDRGVEVYAADSPRGCDRIEMHSTVVKLTGARRTPYYAGQYAALAQGIIAVRNVARNASTAIIAPTILGAEIAYWLSPNYLTRHPMAEVSIAVSRVSIAGRYVAEYTNVYYIDARDVDAYITVDKGVIAAGATQAMSPSPRLTEASLPALAGPARAAVKAPFSGRKRFAAAGSYAAYLVGAATDGSKVVGNTKFYDDRWHVATMTPTGGSAVDLGTMGGIQACATAVSEDGKVIVGMVQLAAAEAPGDISTLAVDEMGCRPQDYDQWTVFRWTQLSDGSSTTEHLGADSYWNGSVVSVLISGDGTTIVATVAERGSRSSLEHPVGWKIGVADDPLNSAWKKQSCPLAAAAGVACSCAAQGVSGDGKQVAIACWPSEERGKSQAFIFSESGWEGFDSSCGKNSFCAPQLSPPFGSFVALSSDFRTAIGKDASLSSAEVARQSSTYGGGALLVPATFEPTGLSSDGRVATGYIRDVPEAPAAIRRSAAIWYAANGSIESPVPVFRPVAFDAGGRSNDAKCAFVVGDYSNGGLLLVNEVVSPANCSPGNGSAAWVIGP